eukprot:6311439-Amphidinium_carterae.2
MPLWGKLSKQSHQHLGISHASSVGIHKRTMSVTGLGNGYENNAFGIYVGNHVLGILVEEIYHPVVSFWCIEGLSVISAPCSTPPTAGVYH